MNIHRPENATAITGIGVLCALGTGWDEFVPAIMEAEPAFSPLDLPQTSDIAAPVWAGSLPPFALEALIRTPKTYLDPHSRATLAAVGLALQAARIPPDGTDGAGILLGTALGNLTTTATFFADAAQKGPRLVKPMLFPHTYANTSISLAAMEWALSGDHLCLTSGSTASGQALLAALDLHREGHDLLLLAGGVDTLHPGFPVLTPADPTALPLPFDPQSAGALSGEAGVMLALQPSAATTGLPRAWLLGGACAAATDAASTPEAIARTIERALADAGLDADAPMLACVSADGDPTRDAILAAGLAAGFAGRRHPLPLMTPAGLCGNVLGATDALLAAAVCAVFETQRIPAAPEGHTAPGLPGGLALPRAARALTGTVPVALTLTLDPHGAICVLALQAGR